MRVAVITNEALREELLAQGIRQPVEITWLSQPLLSTGSDICLDLLFEPTRERIEALTKTGCELILVNYVPGTRADLPVHFFRFNGWPGFLKRPVVEVSLMPEPLTAKATALWSGFGKVPEWVPDQPGFISARVISMIINEAFLTLEEGVSSRNDIDIAMKLGTGYPHGPFEWGSLIGLKNVYDLLNQMSGTNSRYQPAGLLKKEALQP